jgi:23S rRNA pseudouridine2605 synthase
MGRPRRRQPSPEDGGARSGAHLPGSGPALSAEEGERLQKVLARAGLGSRRAAEELIREGRVRVGGRVASLGDRVPPTGATITVDDVPVPTDPDLRYFVLNKPAGVTTTMRDRHADRTVAALLPAGPRVFPVGRLDRESEGLLLLTNDGGLAHRLQHPRFGVEKEYLVEVEGALSPAASRRLTSGIDLDDGVARARSVGRITRGRGVSAVTLVMLEGRKREVRRMFQAIGHRVRRLVRVRLGPIRLGRLPPGKTRPLTPDEVRELYRATGLSAAALRPLEGEATSRQRKMST